MIEILLLTLIITPLLFLFLKKRIDIFVVSVFIQFITISSTIEFLAFYLNHNQYSFSSQINVSGLGALMLITIIFVSNIAISYSYSFLKREYESNTIDIKKLGRFYSLTYIFIAALILVVTTDNVAVSWLGIELSTLSSTFLVGFYTRKTSIEAAWKYFIINSIGVTIVLLGILFVIFSASKYISTDHILNFSQLAKSANLFNPLLIKIGFVLTLIGFGTKVGLFPMHTWLPDAHSKAVTPISGILSSVLLPTALLVILKFKSIVDITLGNSSFTASIMIIFGLMSIIYAAFLVLVQKNYKRLLAYSSIEHMGILVLLFALNTPIAITFACYHYVYHALVKSSLFFLSGNIYLNYHTTKIKKVSDVIKKLPVTGFLFTIFILAIIGLPPFGIFTTEFGLFREVSNYAVNMGVLNLFNFNNNIFVGSVILILLLLSIGIIGVGFISKLVQLIFKNESHTLHEKHEEVSLADETHNEKQNTHIFRDNLWGNVFIFFTLIILVLISFDMLPFVKDLINNFAITSI